MKPILILLASSAIAFSGEISGPELQQARLNKESGTFLVTDSVERISGSGLDKNKFDVRVGGETIPVRFSAEAGTSYSYSGNSITVAEKRTSAKHFSGNSRYDKNVVMQVGDLTTLLVSLSSGRVVQARPAEEKDKIALKFKDAKSQPGGTETVNNEIQARTLLIEINKLKEEVRTGIAGKSTGTVTTQSMTGGGMSQGQTQTTYRFSAAEIAAKKELLELKEAQLQAILQ